MYNYNKMAVDAASHIFSISANVLSQKTMDNVFNTPPLNKFSQPLTDTTGGQGQAQLHDNRTNYDQQNMTYNFHTEARNFIS